MVLKDRTGYIPEVMANKTFRLSSVPESERLCSHEALMAGPINIAVLFPFSMWADYQAVH